MAISGAAEPFGGRFSSRESSTLKGGTALSPATARFVVSRREDWYIFSITTIPLIVLALYAALHLHIYQVDALARSYSAMEAVRGYQPKLANIDLAWPPLPGLLLLPIAWLLPNLTASGAGAPLLSALSAGVCTVLLNRLLYPRIVNRWLRYLVLVTFVLNPMILSLSVSGLSEMTALIFMLGLILAFKNLAEGEDPILPLVKMGVATAGLVVCRFESAALAVLLGAYLVTYFWTNRGAHGHHYPTALTLAYATPVAFVGGVLMFLCATITGNPIYFLTGPGSNGVYTRTMVKTTSLLAGLVHNPISTFDYLVRSTITFAPLYLIIVPIALVAWFRRRDAGIVALLLASFALPGVQFVMLLTGQSAGWRRYLFTNFVFAIVLLVRSLATRVTPGRSLPTLAPWAIAIVLVALIANDGISWYRFNDPNVRSDLRSTTGTDGYMETVFGITDAATYDPQIVAEEGIATNLRDDLFVNDPNAIVLVDNSQATRIVLFSQRENHFISQDTIGFKQLLADPDNTVTYFFVPDTLPERNEILQAYPGIFDGLYPNLTLVSEYDGVFVDAGNTFYRWGLFKVGGTTSAPTSGMDT